MSPQPKQAFVLSDVELGNWCATALRSVFHRGVLDDLRKTIVRDHIDGHVFAWMLRTGRMTTLNVKGVEGTHVCKVREIFYADFPLAKPGAGHVLVYPNNSQELYEVQRRIQQGDGAAPAVQQMDAPLALTNGTVTPALTNGSTTMASNYTPSLTGSTVASNGMVGNYAGMNPMGMAKPPLPSMPKPADSYTRPTSGGGNRVVQVMQGQMPMQGMMPGMQGMQHMQQMPGGWTRQNSVGSSKGDGPTGAAPIKPMPKAPPKKE